MSIPDPIGGKTSPILDVVTKDGEHNVAVEPGKLVPSSLLRLPSEIRHSIYQLLIPDILVHYGVDSSEIHLLGCTRAIQDNQTCPCERPVPRVYPCWRLLLVCRRMYKECEGLIFQRTLFQFHHRHFLKATYAGYNNQPRVQSRYPENRPGQHDENHQKFKEAALEQDSLSHRLHLGDLARSRRPRLSDRMERLSLCLFGPFAHHQVLTHSGYSMIAKGMPQLRQIAIRIFREGLLGVDIYSVCDTRLPRLATSLIRVMWHLSIRFETKLEPFGPFYTNTRDTLTRVEDIFIFYMNEAFQRRRVQTSSSHDWSSDDAVLLPPLLSSNDPTSVTFETELLNTLLSLAQARTTGFLSDDEIAGPLHEHKDTSARSQTQPQANSSTISQHNTSMHARRTDQDAIRRPNGETRVYHGEFTTFQNDRFIWIIEKWLDLLAQGLRRPG